MAHESAWTILAGSLQLAADTSAMPLLNISIYATDLALPTEVILQLQAANMTTLPVRILAASERLSQLTAGAKRDLYYVEKKQSIQIEPVIIDGTQLNFAAKDVVKNHYMWASALHQQSVVVESDNLIGLWLAPSFLPAAHNDSKFAMHHILFDANGSGLNITSGEQFNWSIATDISGNNVVLLNFADNYSVVYSLSQHLEQGYLAHVLIFDDNNILQAATSGLLQKE